MTVLRRFWGDRVALAWIAAVVVVAVAFVTATVGQPRDVEAFTPTPPEPVEVGERLWGPHTVTVDASDPERWRYFAFARGSVVDGPGPAEWDLAFRRFHVVANGGPGFAGDAGVLALGDVPFDSVAVVPASGYVQARAPADSTNGALERWYTYSWTSHLLSSRPTVYAVRTADGRYAKLQMRGYYCEGARPGCVTFRYVYQGAGGPDVAAP